MATDPLARLLAADAAHVCRTPTGALAVAVAACLTGNDPAGVSRLPDTAGRERRIVLQRAHAVELHGLSVLQLLRLVGAEPVEAGTADRCRRDELAAFLCAGAAAALWLEASHASEEQCVNLAWFAWTCRAAQVPSIVMARERTSPLAALDAGVDLILVDVAACYGGSEGGLIAGRADLVAACGLQEHGVGALFLAGAARRQAVLQAVLRAATEPVSAAAWPDVAGAVRMAGMASDRGLPNAVGPAAPPPAQ